MRKHIIAIVIGMAFLGVVAGCDTKQTGQKPVEQKQVEQKQPEQKPATETKPIKKGPIGC